jgi:hypothetical protein
MDGVYQQDEACLVMDFIYHATNSVSGQTVIIFVKIAYRSFAPPQVAANSSGKGMSWLSGYGAYLRLDIPAIILPAVEGVEQGTVLYTDADVLFLRVGPLAVPHVSHC